MDVLQRETYVLFPNSIDDPCSMYDTAKPS